MNKQDFNRLMQLSNSGVSNAVIIHAILEISINFHKGFGIESATIWINKFIDHKNSRLPLLPVLNTDLKKEVDISEQKV